MADEELKPYRRKRDFERTPEPSGGRKRKTAKRELRFTVQEHHARRLHWDLRLEHDGALASWAIPNGIPVEPADNRLAVRTEDHPLEYLDFEGDIPAGEYGAGTMRIWDRGTFELHKWEPAKVEITFRGERLNGRYALFALDRARPRVKSGGDGAEADESGDWMIHRMDPPEDPDRGPMPEHLVPMLARATNDVPRPESEWAFELKWDGVRAIAYVRPGRLRLESRNQREITDSYPEIRGLLRNLGMREAVLDGEIVAFDDNGRPSFERLQRRMHVTSPAAVRRLQTSTPVVYAIFDLLYLDGHSLLELPYEERRERLEELGLKGAAWQVPAEHRGEGRGLLEATRQRDLEGVIAKRLGSPYEPGRRSGAWLKIKNRQSQEFVIVGWLPGEGRRKDRIGALLVGYFEDGRLACAGRVGTGFTERTLEQLQRALEPLQTDNPRFGRGPKLPRNAVFVEPKLVAEVEFAEWTAEGVLRAPSFKGLRDDRDPRDVGRELLEGATRHADPSSPQALFERVERQPDGALGASIDGRSLKLTNWDKVLFPQTGFTKGDLISYYTRIAETALPHVRDRALTLKRYPNGVESQYFYEKQSPSHRPEWIRTERIGDVDYTIVEERATLTWLGNLADVELHTSLSKATDPDCPTMVMFDLDPGPPADIVACCEVALVLAGLFDRLGLEALAKTSGSKGMQVCVPLNTPTTYAATKPFARRLAELLEQRLPDLVTARMTKQLRPRKVLIDWSQNDAHKTTVTAYSVRARERPTVSTPVSWDEVARCREQRDAAVLSFETEDVLARVAAQGDLFAPAASLQQELPTLG
jgi:bifunctional non-homologous end joining protein LigD